MSPGSILFPSRKSDNSIQEQALLSPSEQIQLHASHNVPKRSSIRAIGANGVWILALGTLANLLAVGILTLLWEGARQSRIGGKVPSIWTSILVSGWLSRTITLTALVIRVAVGTQAGICISMLAALLLERFEAPLYEVPIISMMRHNSGGPYNLSWMVTTGSFRGIRSWKLVITIVIALTTLGSNLTSTILFSDLSDGSVTGNADTTDVAFGSNRSAQAFLLHRGVDYWKARPASYPIFAELSQNPIVSEGVKDTGLTLRALLPYAKSDQRTSLRSYIGQTSILDARVTCVRPNIQAKAALIYGFTNMTGFISFHGSLAYSTPLPILDFDDGFYEATFNCSVPLYGGVQKQWTRDREWAASICYINATNTSGMVGFFSNSTDSGEEVLLFNSTGRFRYNDTTWEEGYRNIITWPEQKNEEWLDMTVPQLNETLSATLCFKYRSIRNLEATLIGTPMQQEPALSWARNGREEDSGDVRKMLGATNTQYSRAERGILNLETYNRTSHSETYNFAVAATLISGNVILSNSYQNSPSILMCSYCGNYGPGTIDPHRYHIALFQDILYGTRNPALAIQALHTTIVQMSYYDFLPDFDISAPATVVSVSTMLMPQQWIGFSVVLVILTLHTSLVILITVVYIKGTNISLLGDHWQALAQVGKGETEQVLKSMAHPSRKEARQFIKANGLNRTFVGLGESSHSDNSGVVITRRRPYLDS